MGKDGVREVEGPRRVFSIPLSVCLFIKVNESP